jgi:hypothetical protein
MNLIGCDVFVYAKTESPPDMPKHVGPLKLELISNRGTKLWPAGSAKLDYVADEWRCRYTTEGDQPIDHPKIEQLLKEIYSRNIFWTRVQVLALGPDGSRAFSQPY